MYISRYLKPEHIQLGLREGHLDDIDEEKDPLKEQARLKENVIKELGHLFNNTGVIRNESKFILDLINSEKSCSSAVAGGLAVPQIKSMSPKGLGIIFARSIEGVWFDAPDGQLTHIFFGITCPSYDDKAADHFYKWIAQSFLQEDWLEAALLAAEDKHEIIGILSSLQ